MEIPLADVSARDAYGLLTSVIVPRPIAWVSTISTEGVRNLAPFSYFMGVSSAPPMVAISISERPDGGNKDTLQNILDRGVFCINLVEEDFALAMNETSAAVAPGVDEFAMTGLGSAPCVAIEGARVAGARTALECRTAGCHAYGNVELVVAEVVHAYIDDELLVAAKLRADTDKMAPVARLGGGRYAKLGERFTLARPRHS